MAWKTFLPYLIPKSGSSIPPPKKDNSRRLLFNESDVYLNTVDTRELALRIRYRTLRYRCYLEVDGDVSTVPEGRVKEGDLVVACDAVKKMELVGDVAVAWFV